MLNPEYPLESSPGQLRYDLLLYPLIRGFLAFVCIVFLRTTSRTPWLGTKHTNMIIWVYFFIEVGQRAGRGGTGPDTSLPS